MHLLVSELRRFQNARCNDKNVEDSLSETVMKRVRLVGLSHPRKVSIGMKQSGAGNWLVLLLTAQYFTLLLTLACPRDAVDCS